MSEGSMDNVAITKPGFFMFGEDLPNVNSSTALFIDMTVTQMSCGQDHSAVVFASGQVCVFGKNGTTGVIEIHENISSSLYHVKVVQATCGYQFTLFLTDNGQVYACGDNVFGQLGLGHTEKSLEPKLVHGLPCIKKVAAGYGHSLVLSRSGEIFGSGYNGHGNLGLANDTNSTVITVTSFVRIRKLSGIIDIACGSHYSVLLTKTGLLLVAGSNSSGQLGLALKKDYMEFTPFSTLTVPITAVSCGSDHTVFMQSDGSVLACGNDVFGQLGSGRDPSLNHYFTTLLPVTGLDGYSISQVFAGNSHTALVTSDGNVLLCGKCTKGELGIKQKGTISTPTVLKKAPELVVEQIAFARNYSLFLIGSKETDTLTDEGMAKEKTLPKENKAGITEMEEKILKSLKCAVCYKIMSAPIHICCNGHSACASCWAAKSYCSLCRRPYTNSRNCSLESLSSVLHLPCRDCWKRMPANLLEKHSEVCPSRKYACPVKESCRWRGEIPENLLLHTSSSHPEQTWQTLPHTFDCDIYKKLECTYVLSAHNEVFTLHLAYNRNKFQAFVKYIGPPKNVKKFTFKITLIKNVDFNKVMFVKGVCVDVGMKNKYLYRSDACVTVHNEMLHLYKCLSKITWEVDIVKEHKHCTKKRLRLSC